MFRGSFGHPGRSRDSFWVLNCVVGLDLVSYSLFSCSGRFRASYVGSVRGLRAGVLPDLDLIMGAYRSAQPSLQAFRAKTMVERFSRACTSKNEFAATELDCNIFLENVEN